jgi:hypothetical protein
MNHNDRRRTRLALLVTLAAIPALWFATRSNSDASPAASGASEPPPTTQYEPDLPSFIDSRPPVVPPAVVDVLTPPAPTGQEVKGRANYRRFTATSGNVCSTALAPAEIEITVYNVDNGRTVTCRNIGGVTMPAATDIVIDTTLFSDLGDLTDAPLSVRISWG